MSFKHPIAKRPVAITKDLEDSIQKFDVGRLAELMPRGGGVELSYRFTANMTQEGAETHMQGPPLCVMIERVKTSRKTLPGTQIHELLKVILMGDDPNAVFTVKESWPADRSKRPISMQCNAMSWLLCALHNVSVNYENLKCCITALIKLNADVNLPYKLTVTPYYDGRSLPFVAMEFAGSLKSAQILLDEGARFMPTDPAPFVSAISKFSVNNAVNFFYDNWKTDKITVNLGGIDRRGYTALHIFIRDPRQETEEAAVTILKRILYMGFSPMTTSRDGRTALEYARDRMYNNDISNAIFEYLLLAHKRPLAVAAVGALGRLPVEVGDAVLRHAGYGASSTEVKAALDRVRTNLKKNSESAADD
jgi:hypothetical protein